MHSLSAKRKNDAVIAVVQHNDDRVVAVEGMNQAAERLTGYAQSEVINVSLEKLLSKKLSHNLALEIEYDADGTPLSKILGQFHPFEILSKDNEVLPCSLKVFRVLSDSQDHPHYELLLRDLTLEQNMQELKNQLALNAAEGPALFYPNLELALSFVSSYRIEASVAFLSLDNSQQLLHSNNMEAISSLYDDASRTLGATLREGDMIVYLGDGLLGLILLDCNAQDTQAVLNRLRMILDTEPAGSKDGLIQNIHSFSAGFSQLESLDTTEGVIKKVAQFLQQAQERGGNMIIG